MTPLSRSGKYLGSTQDSDGESSMMRGAVGQYEQQSLAENISQFKGGSASKFQVLQISAQFIIFIMNSRLTLRLLVLLVVSWQCAFAQDCIRPFKAIPNNNISDAQTGHFSIHATNFSSRENRFRMTFRQKYLTSPNLGLSIVYIQGYRDDTGVDFLIQPLITQTYFEAIFTISIQALWVKTHIHFIANNRIDFVTGIVNVVHNSLLDNSKQNATFEVYFQVGNQFTKKNKFIAFALLSGLRSQSNSFNLVINQDDVKMSNNNLTISFTISKKSKSIQILYVTYFAFQKDGPIQVTNLTSVDLFSFISTPTDANDYSIFGTVAYYGQNVSYKKADEIISKNIFKSIAQAAKSNAKPTKRLLETINARYDPRSNMTWEDWTQSRLNISEQRRQYYIDQFMRMPLPTTPTNEEVLQTIEPAWRQSFRNIFQVKGFGEIVNNAILFPRFKSTGILSTDLPQTLKDKIEKNICVDFDQCSLYGKVIVLKDGTRGCEFCSENKQFNPDKQKCECKAGYVASGEDCIQTGKFCGKDYVYQNGSCFNFTKTKDICDQNKNQVFSAEQIRCICQKFYREEVDKSGNFVCYPNCPPDATFNEKTKQCICPIGRHFENGNCVECKRFSEWDASKNACVCVDRSISRQGECLPCAPSATFNRAKNECVCKPGTTGTGLFCRQSMIGKPV